MDEWEEKEKEAFMGRWDQLNMTEEDVTERSTKTTKQRIWRRARPFAVEA